MIYFEKSKYIPKSLKIEKSKKNGKYDCKDVYKKLRADFKDKCYLCEEKEPTSINIEHFIPHKDNIDLKFDWNNLFLACAHCNNIKLAKYNDSNKDILNCTNKNDKVEISIKLKIKTFPKIKVLITAVENVEKINNTAELLNEIFNNKNTQNKITQSEFKRNKLVDMIKEFNDLIEKYEKDKSKVYLKNLIIEHLDSSSAFTAFKRWIIRDNIRLYEDFKNYLK